MTSTSRPPYCSTCLGVRDEEDDELRHYCMLCEFRVERTIEELEEHVQKRHCAKDAPLQSSGEAHFGLLTRQDRARGEFAISTEGGSSHIFACFFPFVFQFCFCACTEIEGLKANKKRSSDDNDTSARSVRGRGGGGRGRGGGRGGRGRGRATGQVLISSAFTRTTTKVVSTVSSDAAGGAFEDLDADVDDKVLPEQALAPEGRPDAAAPVIESASLVGELAARDNARQTKLALAKPKPLTDTASSTAIGVLLWRLCYETVNDIRKCLICRAPSSRSDAKRHFITASVMAKSHALVLEAATSASVSKLSLDAADRKVAEALKQVVNSPASARGRLSSFLQVVPKVAPVMHDLTQQEQQQVPALQREVVLALLVNNNNLAVGLVDSTEMRAIAVLAGWSLPHRKALRARQYEMIHAEREALRVIDVKQMQVMNFTTDMWTKLHTPLIGVTGHYITANMDMRELLVGLVDMKAWSHEAENQEIVARYVIDNRLPADVIQFVVTTDNTNVAVAVANRLSGGEGFGCVLHLTNLNVNDAFNSENISAIIPTMLEKMRSVVSFFHRHELNGALREVQVKAGVNASHLRVLQADNITRWYSKQSMIESSLALQDHLRTMLRDGTLSLDQGESEDTFLLSAAERLVATNLLEPLDIVRSLSRVLERSHSPTMQLVAATLSVIRYRLQRIVTANVLRSEVVVFTRLLIQNFDFRFGDMLSKVSWPTVAAVLSPRHCELWHVTDGDERTNLFSNIINVIVEQSIFINPPLPSNPADMPADMSDDNDASGALLAEKSRRREVAKKGVVAIRQIGHLYNERDVANVCQAFAADHLDGDHDLQFWRAVKEQDWQSLNAGQVPNAQQQAALFAFYNEFSVTIRALLSIQPSSAACERVFSEAGWFLDDYSGEDVQLLEDFVRLRQMSRAEYSTPEQCNQYAENLAIKILMKRR